MSYDIPCELYQRFQYGSRVEKPHTREKVMARETSRELIIADEHGRERRFYKGSGCEVGFKRYATIWTYIEREFVPT